MLKTISDLLVTEGFPKFILTDDILDEKARAKKEKELAKATGRVPVQYRKTKKTFENAVRACALKDIMLRWMDIMVNKAGPKRRYFYRPVSALKSGHKGAVQKI